MTHDLDQSEDWTDLENEVGHTLPSTEEDLGQSGDSDNVIADGALNQEGEDECRAPAPKNLVTTSGTASGSTANANPPTSRRIALRRWTATC